jgi:hypothetical protein
VLGASSGARPIFARRKFRRSRIVTLHLKSHANMDLHDAQDKLMQLWHESGVQLSKVPGSAMLMRYIKSSHQNDPVRTAVELFLFIFFIRYLLAPKYSTQKKGYVELTEEVCRGTSAGLLHVWLLMRTGD